MLERVPFQPKQQPSNDAAKGYVPKFVHRDLSDPHGIDIKEEFYGTRRKLRIAILGAGISTIQFLHALEKSIPLESVDVVVYEKNDEVGGVWLTSRYPGCRSDIPGASYQYSWRPHVWSQWLPPAAETCQYLQTVAKENDFYRFMRFRSEVIRASWTDDEAKWTVQVNDLANGTAHEDKVDLFIELNGPVSDSQLTIKGIEKFKGQVVHTAHWRDEIELHGKKVALLGYGSSGVQIAPEIIKDAAQMYTFFRNQTYIVPPVFPEYAGPDGANFEYTEQQKALLADPDVYTAYRKALETLLNARAPSAVNGSELSILGKEMILGYMKEKLAAKPGLFDKIAPHNFDVGCRRVVFDQGYMEALVDPKTTVLFEEPTRFTEKGFLDSSDIEHEVDIVIAATGYNQTHLPRYPKFVNGEDMSTRWASWTSPPSYMSTCLDGMPNYFNASSAYAAVLGSWYGVIETLSDYMVMIIDKMQIENVVSFKPKRKAVEHFIRHADTFLERWVQSGPCAAWYKTKTNRPAVWPGSRPQFYQVMKSPRFEDFDMVYENEDDMFSYFGNGFTLYPEGDKNGDMAWYIEPKKEVSSEVLEKLRGVHEKALP